MMRQGVYFGNKFRTMIKLVCGYTYTLVDHGVKNGKVII